MDGLATSAAFLALELCAGHDSVTIFFQNVTVALAILFVRLYNSTAG